MEHGQPKQRFSIEAFAWLAVISCFLIIGEGCGGSPVSEFSKLRELVCAGKFQAAIPQLQNYQGPQQARASFFLGKAYVGIGDFEKAKATFAATIRGFPDTDEAHKSQYKIGWIEYLAGNQAEAKTIFQGLAQSPDGPLAAEASAFAVVID
jgi:TolA-binding protein